MSKFIANIGKNCVTCGTCLTVCPRSALTIFKGISAVVDLTKCIGCGKCAKICPAGIIEMIKRENGPNNA